jgi:hypothetical protein
VSSGLADAIACDTNLRTPIKIGARINEDGIYPSKLPRLVSYLTSRSSIPSTVLIHKVASGFRVSRPLEITYHGFPLVSIDLEGFD